MASTNTEDNGHVTIPHPLIFEGPCCRPEDVHIDVEVDKTTLQAVERQTRGQRVNPDWFPWRKNRINASFAHLVSHSRFANEQNQIPAQTYVQMIVAEAPSIQALSRTWGIQKEVLAVQQYQELKSESLGRPVRVQECGLFIDPLNVWLAATPDGIVEDVKTGERLLCLEVKCPYIHRENTVREACLKDRAFCLELEDEKLKLRTNHEYYTQVQCQMGVTGIHMADLAVFTLRETVYVPVTFNLQFWNDTVARLRRFYEGVFPPNVLPEFANINIH